MCENCLRSSGLGRAAGNHPVARVFVGEDPVGVAVLGAILLAAAGVGCAAVFGGMPLQDGVVLGVAAFVVGVLGWALSQLP